MNTRIIVAALVRNNRGETLFCKMPEDRGVFPGQWGIPGGGLDPGEKMAEGLKRELREEIGVEVIEIEPLFFKDGVYEKTMADGSLSEVYMIFLVFTCIAESEEISLNEEFSDYRWLPESDYGSLEMNVETIDTLKWIYKHGTAM